MYKLLWYGAKSGSFNASSADELKEYVSRLATEGISTEDITIIKEQKEEKTQVDE